MKALSVREPWATAIAQGRKTIEVRSRRTHHRGPLLICATQPAGVLRCIVTITKCTHFRPEHAAAANIPFAPGLFAWHIGKVIKLKPLPIKGQLGLFNVPLHPDSERHVRQLLGIRP